jgi:hypothetical protein
VEGRELGFWPKYSFINSTTACNKSRIRRNKMTAKLWMNDDFLSMIEKRRQ